MTHIFPSCFSEKKFPWLRGLLTSLFLSLIFRSRRIFTHGYDIFSPSESVVYHLWSRAHRPTSSEDIPLHLKEYRNYLRTQSQKKILGLLEGGACCGIYGLGTARTIIDYEKHLEVSFLNRKILSARYTNDGIFPSDITSGIPILPSGSKEAKMTAALALVEAYMKSTR